MSRSLIATILSVAAASALYAADSSSNLGSVEVIDTQDKYRNRSETVTPNLVYEREFFERFEPTTVGDMLKRVPGVVFKGDVGEYDFIKFRGLASSYTQILVNGKRLPGNGSDRGLNMDRIPAEMVDRIEIVRSPSAEIDAQGVAGTINIILKDGASMEGGFYRIGVSRHSNGEDNPWTETKYKPNAFLSYGENFETFSYTASAYYQERYNAKDKITNEEDDAHVWNYTEDEWDNRDTKDSSLYAKFDIDVTQDDRLIVSANYFHTDREEEQYEFKQERDTESDPFEVQKIEHQIMDIDQSSYNAAAEYIHRFDSADELSLSAVYDTFLGDLDEYEGKEKTHERDDWHIVENIRGVDYGGELTKTEDQELKGAIGYTVNQIDSHTLKFGIQAQNKHRDTDFSEYEVEDGIYVAPETLSYGTHEIDENRLDAYAEDVYKITGALEVQFGARMEYTDLNQKGTEGDVSNDYTYFNPLLHVKYALTNSDQLRFSVAQTLRRPGFDEMVPFSANDEPADYDELKGNPDLVPERSLGFDLGYEHAFADQFGIIGVNAFHRSVYDKIEYRYLGTNEVEDDGEIVTGGKYTYDNVGDGSVYGFELDSSFPLGFIGLPSVSFFGNYTYLDSEVEDDFTGEKHRFNDQPDYVYNVGLTHTIKPLGLSYGFSYQQRGDSTNEEATKTEVTSYDANLEAYIEYKAAEYLTLRFTGDNLLDAEVTEEMKNYESLEDKKAGKIDTYETQIERAGSVFMLTLSGRF